MDNAAGEQISIVSARMRSSSRKKPQGLAAQHGCSMRQPHRPDTGHWPNVMPTSFVYIGALSALLLLAGISKIALATGTAYVLFPELGALAYDVFTRPSGVWARSPAMLAFTPTAASIVGIAITREFPFGIVSVVLCIGSAMVLLRVLRSPIAPAISAGFLPLALGVTSWAYPASIAAVTGTLAILIVSYRWLFAARIEALRPVRSHDIDNRLESVPTGYVWLPVFVGFLLLTYGITLVTGNRLILFPPLVVIAFEMFAHADVCPWARRPFTLPVACTFVAAVGVAAVSAFGFGPLSVTIALIAGIVALRIARLHLPPALAIGLLPQVIAHPDWTFVAAVAVGSTALTATFLIARTSLMGQTRSV
ncbi:MAG: putative rane protein [Caballeronia sp.]|nr:putative rane protein [Caballeronia sp.]